MNLSDCIGNCVAVVMIAAQFAASSIDQPTMDEVLARKVEFESNSDTLESAVKTLANKLRAVAPDISLQIQGEDLKREGFTKNQRIRGVKVKEATVAEVLTAVVIAANPDSSVTDPKDPRLKLVWGVAAAAENPQMQWIVITTRAGAAKRKLKLPGVFDEHDEKRPTPCTTAASLKRT